MYRLYDVKMQYDHLALYCNIIIISMQLASKPGLEASMQQEQEYIASRGQTSVGEVWLARLDRWAGLAKHRDLN